MARHGRGPARFATCDGWAGNSFGHKLICYVTVLKLVESLTDQISKQVIPHKQL